ncbi:hypothetical protein GGH99_005006, partial [Coemansia sp. RSA 1285]
SHDAYSEDPATRRFPYKIIAPKLSSLKAVLCPFTHNILASIFGLSTIQHVDLEMDNAAFMFKDLNIDNARYAFARYASYKRDNYFDKRRNAYMNHLLGIEDLAGYSKARVLCYDSAIDYDALAWKSIMDLQIHGTVGLADLLVLIHRAPPCLLNISVSELSFDSRSEIASQVMDKDASVHPIASNLCSLKYELVHYKLALLAVCKMWRELGHASVHRTCFVSCISAKKYNFTADREAGGRDSDELDSIYRTEWTAQSNLDIFHLSGYPSTKKDDCGPRDMQIYIQSPLNPVFSLQGIVEKLGVHSGLLGNVRRLELFVDFIQTDSSWIRHSASMASACKIASVFAKLVPSVRYIEWQADLGAPVFSVFAKHLVSGYAGQLTGLLCPQMALEETQESSSSLTQVALVNAFDRPNRMPHICVENLTVLDLHLNEYSAGWNLLKGKNESTSLHFDNLAWLRIKGKNDYNARADYVDSSKFERLHEYKAFAPKLKTLEATVSPFTNILLASIYGVSAIRDVKLELNDAVLCYQNLCIDPVRNVFLKHAYDRNGKFEAVDQDVYDDEYEVAEGLALRMHRALWLPSFVIVIALGFWETVYCVLHRMVSSEADADGKINTYIREHRQQHEERQGSQEQDKKTEDGKTKTAAAGTRVAIVTGANGGIGMETARALGLAGFTTILACRNSKRGQNALSALENSTGLRDGSAFRLMELDLASFASIERFAGEVERLYGRVHVLVCNAGTAFSHYDTTYDGLEAQFGTNFVGHYVLANRLEPALRRAGRARITVAASVAACMVHEIDYTRVTDVWRFGRFANYATSKLALLVFARALARRLDGSGVTVNAFHPGIVATSLYRNVLFTMLPGVDGFLRRWLWLDQRAGAVTSVYLALSPELDGKSGGYYARELPAATHPDALDVAAQDRLCCFTDILIATNTHAPTLLQSINAAATSSSSSSSV